MKIELYGAAGNWQRTILIEKAEKDQDNILYTITNPVFNLEGEVEVVLRDLASLQDEDYALSHSIEPYVEADNPLIAEIARFFPYGYTRVERMPKRFQRKGVGTAVLRTLMHDLFTLHDVQHFYVRNPEIPFFNLLGKHEFAKLHVEEYPERNNHLYRRVLDASKI